MTNLFYTYRRKENTMKKVRGIFIFCALTALLLAAACGTTEPSATPTDEPIGTEAQQQTDTPDATEAPEPTKAPVQDITYTFNDLEWVASYGVEYSVKEDGSIDLQGFLQLK